MQIDVHQHVWTEPLLEALAARREVPFIRREHELTVLHLAGERPYVIDAEAERPARRAALVREDRLDRALVCPSSTIGIEGLRRDEAQPLIDAYHDGVLALPAEFGAWGTVALDSPDPEDVDALLARGFVGVCLPANALTGAEALGRVATLLERLERRGAPLLIHPGRATQATAATTLSEPLWWPALTAYVADMQAAWMTFQAAGRRDFPTLRVVFAMLAGGAPLLHERLAARGGPRDAATDSRSYYDSSSYGPFALEAMARCVGEAQLVYGSDRPVVEPQPTGRERLLGANAAHFFQTGRVAA
jgi:predicted TIM-barrel fold metal-dependent hydrolase